MKKPEKLIIGIEKSVRDQIIRCFAGKPVEQGCLLGSSRYLNRIDRFAPVPGQADMDSFTPDMMAVNNQIARWRREGICFSGFIHSHPDGAGFLSPEDCRTIESWVHAANLPFLCFGVADIAGDLKLYLACQQTDGTVRADPMAPMANEEDAEYIQWEKTEERI